MTTSKGGTLIGKLLGRREGRPEDEQTAGGVSAISGPREVVNDATGYGVQIHPAAAPSGTIYWQAARVHHLTPGENGGNHHIYLDVCEGDAGPGEFGGRVNGARLRITWGGGEQVVTVDKPANEPGTNFPMWKWQVCAVECLGASGQDLPSDRVIGLHTGHPDEAPGNTLFHHSFSITFVKAQAAEQVYSESVIYGVIHNGSGRNALLLRDGEEVALKTLGADETFRFPALGAGDYVVAVEGAEFRSDVIRVNGRDHIMLDLTLILRQSIISGTVHGGAGRAVNLYSETKAVAEQTVTPEETYRFEELEAGSYRVVLRGTQIASEVLTLDGVNSVIADLAAPAEGRLIEHYVLFGPNDQPRTRVALLLAGKYILAFRATFGFNAAEALSAARVTIIGGEDDVSAGTEEHLAALGATVQRISGSTEEMAAALASRIAAGRAFG